MTDTAGPFADIIAQAFAGQTAGVAARRLGFGLAERRDALTRLAAAIRKNETALVAAMATDFGKPEAEVILTELVPVLQEIRHASRHLRRWMRPRRVAPTLAVLGTSACIRPEARGVCLIIAPWNYPFSLALGPLVFALAAGNSAIIKPSEMTPATSALIKQNDPPHLRVKIAPHRRATSAARPTVQHHNGDTVRVSALFDIDIMTLPHGQHTLVERVNGRIKILHRAFLIGKFVHHRPI